MKINAKRLTVWGIIILQPCIHGFAQGFVNLDFESASLPFIPAGQYGSSIPVSSAFPGWQVFYGSSNSPVNSVLHNNYNFGTINVSVIGPDFSDIPRLQGSFTPFLQSGFSGSPNPEGRTVSLSQVGLVPLDAQSLQFKVGGFGATNFNVLLNGQNLSLYPLMSSADYTLWGVPVTAFTGQSAELRFTVLSPPERVFNNISVDSFEFLTTAVPEPNMWALLGLGSALFWCAARWRRK